MRRIVVFSLNDPEGKGDRYVSTLLAALKECAEEVYVVTRTAPQEEGLGGDVIINSDKASHNYLCAIDHIGQERLSEFDEMVMMGSSYFGPLYPLTEMFDEMANRDVDFWTLTAHSVKDRYPYPYTAMPDISEQSGMSFMVFRSGIFKGETLWEYLREVPSPGTVFDPQIDDSRIETGDCLSEKGYTGDAYMCPEGSDDLNPFRLLYQPKTLFERYRCPVLDIRVFTMSKERILENTAGESAVELYESLVRHGRDTSDIWEYLIRAGHPCDFVEALGMYYVLPTQVPVSSRDPVAGNKLRAALCMHLFYLDMLEDSLAYAENAPESMDIYVTTATEDRKEAIEKAFSSLPNRLEIRLVENRGRNESALLVGLADIMRDYDFICFYHDKKTASIEPHSIGRSSLYKLQQCTLPSKTFAFNVIETFLRNPRIGLLCPPEANHSFFSRTAGNEWGPNFSRTKNLYDQLKLTAPIAEDKPPVAPYGSVFWFRCAAMRRLTEEEWSYDMFPPEPGEEDNTLLHAIERIYPFVIQSDGYIPAYLLSDSFASLEVSNLRSYLSAVNRFAKRNNIVGSFSSLISYFQFRLDRGKKDIADNEYLGNVPASTLIKRKLKKTFKKKQGGSGEEEETRLI